MNRLFKLSAGIATFALPAIVLAEGNTVGVAINTTNAFDILGTISSIFGVLIPLLVTFAVIYIIVGVIKYATAADDEAQTTARKSILHGIIALFVIVSIWGLVAILNSTFEINQNGANSGACQPVYVPSPTGGSFVLPPGC